MVVVKGFWQAFVSVIPETSPRRCVSRLVCLLYRCSLFQGFGYVLPGNVIVSAGLFDFLPVDMYGRAVYIRVPGSKSLMACRKVSIHAFDSPMGSISGVIFGAHLMVTGGPSEFSPMRRASCAHVSTVRLAAVPLG